MAPQGVVDLPGVVCVFRRRCGTIFLQGWGNFWGAVKMVQKVFQAMGPAKNP